MGDTPRPPALPANLPGDLRAFFECTADSVTFVDGALEWVDGQPKLTIVPGKAPGTATISVTVMGASVSLPASITNGALAVDTSKWDWVLPDGVQGFIKDVNAWFKHKGKGWAPPTFHKGTTTLRKVPLAPPVTVSPSATTAPPPTHKAGPPAPGPKPPKVDPPPKGGNGGTQPLPYYEPKYVTPPPLPNAEMFPPASGTVSLEDVGLGTKEAEHAAKMAADAAAEQAAAAKAAAGAGASGGPVVGAGGPGGPKAPAGLGGLALRGVVLVIFVAILGLGGFVILGGGGDPLASRPPVSGSPASSTQPSNEPSTAAQGCPVAAVSRFVDELEDAMLRVRLGEAMPDAAFCDTWALDAAADHFEYSGTPLSIQPRYADTATTTLFRIELTADGASQIVAACADRASVFCGSGNPSAGAYTVWGIGMTSPVEQQAASFYEAALAFLDPQPPEGGIGTPWEGPTADPLAGMNVAYSLRFPSLASKADIAGPFRLVYDAGATRPSFMDHPTTAFALLSGDLLLGFIPEAEWEVGASYRLFTYFQADDATNAGVDLVPEPGSAPLTAPETLTTLDVR